MKFQAQFPNIKHVVRLSNLKSVIYISFIYFEKVL